MTTLRITNASKDSILATHAQIANTPATRRQGLIGLTSLPIGSGLFFPECSAIHTVEMTMIIDVIFVDVLKRRIEKIVPGAVPGCHFYTLVVPREISAVLELPAGVIELTGSAPGDVLVFMSSSHCSQEELSEIGRL
jgi:uncharacterized membrane protein (UPF0127 family)